MAQIIKARYALRSGTSAQWAAADEVLGAGEVGEEVTTDGRRLRKIGNGSDKFSALPYRVNYRVDESVAPADKQVLTYDQTSGLWLPKDAAGGVSFQPGIGLALDSGTTPPTLNSTLGSIAVTNDVASYANLPTLTAVDAGQYWVTRDTNIAYRWSGSAWPAPSAGLNVGGRTMRVFSAFPTAFTANWSNYTVRVVMSARALSTPFSAIRFVLFGGNASGGVANMYVARAKNNSSGQLIEFDGTPAPVTFGGTPSVTLTAGSSLVSDWAHLAVPTLSSLVVAMDLTIPSASSYAISSTTQAGVDFRSWYRSGVGDSANPATAAYSISAASMNIFFGIDVQL